MPRTRRQRGAFSLTQNGVNTRLTWQAAQKHKVSFYLRQSDAGLGRQPGRRLAGIDGPLPLPGAATGAGGLDVAVDQPAAARSAVRAIAARHSAICPARGRRVALDDPGDRAVDQRFSIGARAATAASAALFGFSAQNIHNAVVDVSYVTGAHSLKFGFSDTWSDDGQLDEFERRPTCTTASTAASRTRSRCTARRRPGASKVIGGDRPVRAGSVDAQPHDREPRRSLRPVQRRLPGAAPRAGAVSADARPDVPGGHRHQRQGRHAAARRVATTCSATARRRSRSSLGKYPLGVSTIGNPAGITNTVTRTWTDANRNFAPDCNLLNLQSQDLRASGGDFCGTVSSLNFGQPTSVTKFNEDTRFGWGNRGYNWEFSTSVQHQLAPRVAVDVGYFRRWFGNFQVTQNLLTTSADFTPYSFTAPLDPRSARRRRVPGRPASSISTRTGGPGRQLHDAGARLRQPDRALERRRRQRQRPARARHPAAGRRQRRPDGHRQLRDPGERAAAAIRASASATSKRT